MQSLTAKPQKTPTHRRIVTGQFGKVPTWLVYSNWISHMRRSELAVLFVLICRQDQDGQCAPTLQTIATESGVSLKSIPAVTDRLGELLAIRKTRHGNRVRYEVLEPPHFMTERGYYQANPVQRPERDLARNPLTGTFERTSQQHRDLDSLSDGLDFKQIPKSTERVIPRNTEHHIPKERWLELEPAGV